MRFKEQMWRQGQALDMHCGKGFNRDTHCAKWLKKTVNHHETHQYMPINTDPELANVVLANEQHMDI